jgi:parallel beta-helix repeat protein
MEGLEARWLPSTIGVTTTSDLLNINPTETIDQVNAGPLPMGGITLRDCIVAANNSGPGSVINFDPLQTMTPSAMVNLNSPLPAVTANGVTISAQRGGAFEITLNGSGAGLADGLDLLGNDCGVVGLSILNFKVDGFYVQGMNDSITGCGVGIGLNNNAGGNESGVVLSGAVAADLDSNLIQNNFLDGIVVDQCAGVVINNNTIENNGADGIRVVGQMNNPVPTQTTQITDNAIQLNGANGIQLVNSSNNQIGKSGALGLKQANSLGSDPHLVWGPNGGDGILIQSFGAGQSTNNDIRENIIGGNNANGVALTGAGTSDNHLINNVIGQGAAIMDEFFNFSPLPNKLDGVAITRGAHDNVVGGPGLFVDKDPQNGAGNIIGPNLGNGVRLSDPGTTGNMVLGNMIGTSDSGDAIKDIHGHALGNVLYGVAVTDGASNNTIGGTGGVHTVTGQGNLISGNTQGGVDLKGAGTTSNMVQGNFIGTDVTGTVALANGGNGVTIERAAFNNFVNLANLISGNGGDGVQITDPGTFGNQVQQNEIGTTLGGDQPLGNSNNGVFITNGATANMVGGAQTPDGTVLANLISGNQQNGVEVLGIATTNNAVVGNLIGSDKAGDDLAGLGNGVNGVSVIANATSIVGNLIAGNQSNGVALFGSHNRVQGNRIGTDLAGSAALPNQGDGVVVFAEFGPGDNTIGGTTAGSGNLISGNVGNGIRAFGPKSSFASLIQGNKIGTDETGEAVPVPNQLNGVLVDNTSGYVIGGLLATAGNLISGNFQDGVKITGNHSTGIFVLNNRIGTDQSGAVAIANQGNGVEIVHQAHHNLIGPGNVISGNVGDGVQISHDADTNFVRGNRIGTDASGTVAVPNQGNGVNIFYRSIGNVVGGTSAAAANVISGNVGDGVRLAQSAQSNSVFGNLIGTDVTGTTITGTNNQSLGNQHNGVEILSASDKNTIGMVSAGGVVTGNVISGNSGSGVVIWGASRNIVQGNRIGTDKSGQADLGNLADGVDILNGASMNQIGGPGPLSAGAPNIISANDRDGVRIWGPNTKFNLLAGNLIGTDSTGQAPLGNSQHGVFLFAGGQDNIIGGIAPASGNVIAFNGAAGVAVGGSPFDVTTIHNPILSNSIFANVGLGIDLADDGVTPNTPGGPHMGPNEFQNFPMIESATVAGSTTTIHLSLSSIHSTVFYIQIFANSALDPSGYGQGRTLVATVPLVTNASGFGEITITLPQNLKGQYLTATATALGGFLETSEFSRDFLV